MMRKLIYIFVLSLLCVFCVFVLLEGGVRIFGAVFKMKKNTANRQVLSRNGDALRVLCLGDSMTHNQYPLFISQVLGDIDSSIKFSVFDEGVAGSNSSELVARAPQLLERYKPDFVVCMMGCNDDDDGQILDYGDVRSPLVYKWMRRLRSFELLYMLWWNLKQKNAGARQGSVLQEPDNTAKCRELEAAVMREPENAGAHFELAEAFTRCGLNDKALEHWRKAQEIEPTDVRVYGRLVTFCPPEEKEKWIEMALGLEAEHGIAAEEIAAGLIRLERFGEALMLALRATEKNPENAELYSLAAFSCIRKKDYVRAHEILKQGLIRCPGELVLVRAVNQLYSMKRVSPDPDIEKMLYSDTAYALPVLERNFARLGRLTDGVGAVLVAVQYPTLDVSALKRMLAGRDNVCFVDNGQLFVDAVRREGYGAVFLDNFGGSFGHCTDYGNRLLGVSVARVIMARLKNQEK